MCGTVIFHLLARVSIIIKPSANKETAYVGNEEGGMNE